MAIVGLNVSCISKDLCQNCKFIDLEVKQFILPNGQNRNAINCSKYEQCSKMLKYLNIKAEDKTDETDE